MLISTRYFELYNDNNNIPLNPLSRGEKKFISHSPLQRGLRGMFIILIISLFSLNLYSEEGMWTFDNPPLKQLLSKYGFTPTGQWFDHIRFSCVRLNDGGSGSFVSPNGLIMTNHHVGVSQLSKISNEKTDYVKDGFYADTQDKELKCTDLEVNVLVAMENVSARVKSAVKEGMSEKDALAARKSEIAKIEKESYEKTNLRSDVVSLYHGGEYWLYRYKKYTDIRLVMAPEKQAAFFGGDDDNFTYPRFNLDMTFFRIYEDGKPINSSNFLKWNAQGAKNEELVFVAGHPGSTDRQLTHGQLEFQRDYFRKININSLQKRINILREYSKNGPEQERRASTTIYGMSNSLKANIGILEGLQNFELMENHQAEENKLRKLVSQDPDLQKKYGNAWDEIQKIVELNKTIAKKYYFRGSVASSLLGSASTLVRYVTETKKPDSDRLDGYHDSQLPGLRERILSTAPIYKDLDEVQFAGSLQMAIEELGRDDEYLQIIIDGKNPAEIAKMLVNATQLDKVEFRKSLLEGGESKVLESNDPFIILAKKLDKINRDSEKWFRENIESGLTSNGEKIAAARFAVYGKNLYPDATFTLRVSYGTMKGYPMNGTIAPYKNTLYGMYDRALSFDEKGDFWLPKRFWERKDKLDLSTPCNFVCSCDIIGGNSGSPVINTKGEVVGLVFDGNIESLPGRFIFDEKANRTVAVHTGFMTEALRKLYDAEKLANEIEGK